MQKGFIQKCRKQLHNIKYVYFNKYEVRRFDEAFDCIPTHQEYINMLDDFHQMDITDKTSLPYF